jgi:hypothetical protein
MITNMPYSTFSIEYLQHNNRHPVSMLQIKGI